MSARSAAHLVLLSILVAGCREAPVSVWRGPIVLITTVGWRSDLLEEGSPAVHLRRLAQEAPWSGAAVVASGDPAASLASLLTGLRPWQHQLLGESFGELRSGVETLAEILARAGYASEAWVPAGLRRRQPELLRGFEIVEDVEALAHPRLASIGDRSQLLWIHLGGGDRKASYGEWIAAIDAELGAALASLRRSAAWDAGWLVVTSICGARLGDGGDFRVCRSLDRGVVEVPTVLKPPPELPLEVSTAVIEQRRLQATLVEAVGEKVPPASSPGLQRVSVAPVLSELYWAGGENRFSLVEGGRRATLSVPFQTAGSGPPQTRRRFLLTPPLAGRPDLPRRMALELEGDGGSPLDPRAEDTVLRAFRRRWSLFVEAERPPRDERLASER